jgi:hypothetical protein
MREIGSEWQSAHNLAKCGPPPAPRRYAMLELTRRRGQADVDHESYDFSLAQHNSPIFSGA